MLLVVGECAAVDPRRAEEREVPGMLAVVDALARGVLARGDARFEVDDVGVRPDRVEHLQLIPPRLGADRLWL